GEVCEGGGVRVGEGVGVRTSRGGAGRRVGETRRYGVSGTLLAAAAGRLLVPVAHNAGYYWPRRGLMKKPGTVRVVIGPPVATAGREARAVNEEISAWVEATVKTLTPT